MKEGKDADDHGEFESLDEHACEELESEKFKDCSANNMRQDQNDTIEGVFLDQQQEEDTDGESELKQVTCEDGLRGIINYGSSLLTKDEKNGKYRITQGILRSMKSRSIDNLYKCTPRLSPIKAEYNWSARAKEDPNMCHLTKQDSSIQLDKKNVGCERKGRNNKNNNGEKDVATSSP